MAPRQKAPRYITQNMLNRCTAAAIVVPVLHSSALTAGKNLENVNPARDYYHLPHPWLAEYPRARISAPPHTLSPPPSAGIAVESQRDCT